MKKKMALKASPLCSPHQVKAPDDLHLGLGQRHCLKASAEFQPHCAFPLFFDQDLHILTIKNRKYSCHCAPDELLRDKWIRVCFLAALSEESILFITAGWAAEEWLATPALMALVMPGIWDFESQKEETLKWINRCPKQSNPPPVN